MTTELRYSYIDTQGVERVLRATSISHAFDLVYRAELERSGSLAAAAVAARSTKKEEATKSGTRVRLPDHMGGGVATVEKVTSYGWVHVRTESGEKRRLHPTEIKEEEQDVQ